MPLSPKDVLLSSLYQNCLFRSTERSHSHEQVSRELTDHQVSWKRGAADVAMFKGQLKRLQLYVLQYGAEVEVRPRPFEDFSLVHTSLSGGTEVECDNERLYVAEGRTALLSPRQRVSLRWHPGSVQLILRLPHALIREVQGSHDDEVLALAPGVLVPHDHCAQWDLLLQSLLNAMNLQSVSKEHDNWLEHFERNVVMFLMAQQPQAPSLAGRLTTVQQLPDNVQAMSARGFQKHMDAMLNYVESRLCAPVSLSDLARAAGVSIRTLNMLCHHHHGVPPMELLRNMRLDAVRTHLILHPHAPVAATAMSMGFGHLGRFAAYYKARFGELPHETLMRHAHG